MAVVVAAAAMPRKNRRDCRTEEKKKAGASAPREAQIRAIQKQRKSGAVAGEGGSDGAAAGERVRCRVYAAPTAALLARVAEPEGQS